MDFDTTLRWGIVIVGVAGSLLWVLGGLLTPVEGRWADGDRDIALTQWGPMVKGFCQRPGGGERYHGWAFFGWLSLRRSDFGQEHLAAMGFSPERARLVSGNVTAYLKLRLRDGRLVGSFQGCKFSFSAAARPRIVAVRRALPTDRVWRRRG